jgi:hypothetical protein
MGVGFRNSRREQNFKPGGGGISRNSEDQIDTLLLTPGFRISAIVRHVLKQHPSFPAKRQTRMLSFLQ